jgi:hypothetical protein
MDFSYIHFIEPIIYIKNDVGKIIQAQYFLTWINIEIYCVLFGVLKE